MIIKPKSTTHLTTLIFEEYSILNISHPHLNTQDSDIAMASTFECLDDIVCLENSYTRG